MELIKLQKAFNNTLFYKNVMIKNSLETYFGYYTHNLIEVSDCYFIIEMTPQSYMKNLQTIMVKFDYIPSMFNELNKIIKVSLI